MEILGSIGQEMRLVFNSKGEGEGSAVGGPPEDFRRIPGDRAFATR